MTEYRPTTKFLRDNLNDCIVEDVTVTYGSEVLMINFKNGKTIEVGIQRDGGATFDVLFRDNEVDKNGVPV